MFVCLLERFKSLKVLVILTMEDEPDKNTTIVSDFDLFALLAIHKCFLERKKCGNGELVRARFGNIKGRDYTNENNFVLKRMLILREKDWVVSKKNDKRWTHKLNYKKVSIEKHRFPDKRVTSILVKDHNDKWMAFEV
jgi:hypothetical protein